MILFLQSETYAPWLAPYAYGIVIIGFLFFLFRAFENWYSSKFHKPLFRNYLIYKKLKPSMERLLQEEFSFYQKLSRQHKNQFQHRVVCFFNTKKFVGREDLIAEEEMRVLIAAIACMLSFGRKNYKYSLIDFILIYPGEFYSAVNDSYHKTEFNPKEKTLVLSWDDFQEGLKNNDMANLGIYSFVLAMQLEAKTSRDLDSTRFNIQFQNILKRLSDKEIKESLEHSPYFKEGFSNQFEFMGILVNYFLEKPDDLQSRFPKLYIYVKRLLNFNFAAY